MYVRMYIHRIKDFGVRGPVDQPKQGAMLRSGWATVNPKPYRPQTPALVSIRGRTALRV